MGSPSSWLYAGLAGYVSTDWTLWWQAQGLNWEDFELRNRLGSFADGFFGQRGLLALIEGIRARLEATGVVFVAK
jgi:hypothetical protein